jgi:hypothetical protein
MTGIRPPTTSIKVAFVPHAAHRCPSLQRLLDQTNPHAGSYGGHTPTL